MQARNLQYKMLCMRARVKDRRGSWHAGKHVNTYRVPAGDGHFRVATAALAVLSEAVRSSPTQLEPYADRLLPKVAWRLVDAKAGIREATHEVMAGAMIVLSGNVHTAGYRH